MLNQVLCPYTEMPNAGKWLRMCCRNGCDHVVIVQLIRWLKHLLMYRSCSCI